MASAAWILVFILASIGLVQCGFWLADAFSCDNGRDSIYCVIPVYDEPDQVEVRVRSALSRIRRSRVSCETVLIADMGLGEESRHICDKLAREDSGAYICERGRIPEIVEELERPRLWQS